MKKKVLAVLLMVAIMATLTGCFEQTETQKDIDAQQKVSNNLVLSQPTPKDIKYSLERYNLIKRAYWVNGMEEKARAVECPVEKPLGYIVLISAGTVMAKYTVDGKVSSLNSFLTPDSERAGDGSTTVNDWLSDVDGSYGENSEGVFFFTPDGEYHEWVGDYLYSSSPMDIKDPVVKVEDVSK